MASMDARQFEKKSPTIITEGILTLIQQIRRCLFHCVYVPYVVMQLTQIATGLYDSTNNVMIVLNTLCKCFCCRFLGY